MVSKKYHVSKKSDKIISDLISYGTKLRKKIRVFHKQILLGLLAASLITIFYIYFSDDDTQVDSEGREKVGEIILAEDVQRKHHNLLNWKDIKNKESVYHNDKIFTGEDGEATIQLGSKKKISLGPNTLVVLQKEKKELALSIEKGTFIGSLAKGQKLTIISKGKKSVIFAKKAANIELNVVEKGKINIFVKSGQLEIKDKKNKKHVIAKKGVVFFDPEKETYKVTKVSTTLIHPKYNQVFKIDGEEVINFKWKKNQGDQKYFLDVSKTSSFEKVEKTFETTDNTHSAKHVLGRRIYWRVRIQNEKGDGVSNISTYRIENNTSVVPVVASTVVAPGSPAVVAPGSSTAAPVPSAVVAPGSSTAAPVPTVAAIPPSVPTATPAAAAVVVDTKMADPILIEDPDSKIFYLEGESLDINFRWNEAKNADKYELKMFKEEENGERKRLESKELLKPEFVIAFKRVGKYIYTAKNIGNKPDLVGTRLGKFKIIKNFLPADLITPKNKMVITRLYKKPLVKFLWKSDNSATSYQLQVADSNIFSKETILEQHDLKVLKHDIFFSKTGSYYWRVMSLREGTEPIESVVRKFTIIFPGPSSPTPYGDKDAYVINEYKIKKNKLLKEMREVVVIEWSHVKGAKSYKLNLYKKDIDKDSYSLLRTEYTFSNNFNLNTLEKGAYAWHVRSIDKFKRHGKYSKISTFEVKYNEQLRKIKIRTK